MPDTDNDNIFFVVIANKKYCVKDGCTTPNSMGCGIMKAQVLPMDKIDFVGVCDKLHLLLLWLINNDRRTKIDRQLNYCTNNSRLR